MPESETGSASRVIFLDNLRYFFVLCVVLEHAAHSYDGLNWWPVVDTGVSLIARFSSGFSDAISMPLLFYVSGYFAIPTIRKKGTAVFLKGKLRRLGIPWLVCILTICPVLPLLYHYTRNPFTLSESYGSLWLELTGNMLRFDVGLIPSMNKLMMNNGFYQRYMWFLSLLVLFFFIFAAVYGLKKDWFDRGPASLRPAPATVRGSMKLLLGVGFLTTVFSFTLVGLMMALGPKSGNPEPLFTLGNIIQFRPSRLPAFVICFSLGVLTFRNQWIGRGRLPGHFRTWAVSFGILLAGLLMLMYILEYGPEDMRPAYGALYFLVLNFMTMAALGFSAAVGLRYWNRPSAFDRTMAANSYNIYLGHYLFVLVAQLFLLFVPGLPLALKFALVSAFAIGCSYAVSRYLIQPHPRAAVAAAAGLLLAMVVFVRP
ncbi:MAG: acyltransferase family protein [Proteobacteria bacterium]|nr:acyltransferase family protein [Pseudomonadota bacterium]